MNLLTDRKAGVPVTCFLLLLCFLSGQSFAQNEPAAIQTPEPKTENTAAPAAYIHYGQVERWQEEDVQVTAFTNKIELYQAGRILKADTMIARNKTIKENTPPSADKNKNIIFDEVYAEGNVKIIDENDLITADRFYYNFVNDTGIIINFEIRTSAPDNANQEIALVFKADVAYQINKSTITAKNASVTTCPHGQPHYFFWASSVSFVKDETGKHIIIHNIVPHIAGIPVFYFPYYKKTLGDDSLIRSARISKSTRFGKNVNLRLGYNIKKYLRNEKKEIVKDKNGFNKQKLWGDLTLDEHWFEKRGTASEPNLDFRWSNYEGFVSGYHILDKGPDPKLAYHNTLYSQIGSVNDLAKMQDKDRGRAHLFGRYAFNSRVRADIEFNHSSDRYFLPEFFNREYKEQKPPESYAYLRYQNDNLGVVAVQQFQANDFQTEWDYQPKVKAFLINEPFMAGDSTPFMYYDGSMELAKINLQNDSQTHLGDTNVSRFDTYNELSSPFQIGFVKLTPFASARWTGYDRTTAGKNSEMRFIGSEGLRSFMQFSRNFDFKQKTLGLTNPMHIISFDARYTNNSNVSMPSSDLMKMDNTDRYDKLGEWYFEIRNRFKNKIDSDAGTSESAGGRNGNYREFLNVGLAIERYSRPISGLAANYLYPMNWLSIMPTTKEKGGFPQREFSNLNLDILFTPSAPYSLKADVQYNTNDHRIEFWGFNANLTPYPSWMISLSGSFILDRTEAYTLGLTCSPIEKWELSISDQYDFWEQTFLNRRYSLRRDLHEFFLEFAVNIDKSKNEKNFYITASPKVISEQLSKFK